ncbi:MAG: hypothetical protein OEV21_07750 [Thermoplasmata archaeon]|nr:hypothetical protein [Thermoplasmata archaeon]
MKATTLGKSQRAVLYADIGYPEKTDVGLSKIIGISPGRISTIRSQLIHDGYYHEIKIPSLDLLGYEGIGIVIAEPKIIHPSDRAGAQKIMGDVAQNPNILYAIENGEIILFVTAFPRLSQHEEFADQVFESCCRFSKEECDISITNFPLEHSKIYSFWDFSSLLYHRFNLHIIPPKESTSYGRNSKHVEFDMDDLRILDIMVRQPVANDADLAKLIGVSLSTFRRNKDRVMSNGLCKRAFVPDISKLGFELCVFSLLRLNPLRTRMGEIDHIRSLVSPLPFLMMSRKSMAFIGHCFSDYTSYTKYSANVLSELKKGLIHMDVLRTITCSTMNMREIKPLDFSGVLTPLLS